MHVSVRKFKERRRRYMDRSNNIDSYTLNVVGSLYT